MPNMHIFVFMIHHYVSGKKKNQNLLLWNYFSTEIVANSRICILVWMGGCVPMTQLFLAIIWIIMLVQPYPHEPINIPGNDMTKNDNKAPVSLVTTHLHNITWLQSLTFATICPSPCILPDYSYYSLYNEHITYLEIWLRCYH